MRTNREEISRLLQTGQGVISRRDHPELVQPLSWLVRRGELVAVLPGVYAAAQQARDRDVRVRAVMLAAPDAVLVGPAAAYVSFWPRVPMTDITVAVLGDRRIQARGFLWTRRTIPPELVVHARGLRYSTPALTALDLCSSVGGDGIDTALRTRAATLSDLHEALAMTSRRSGNCQRRQLLLDSRDEPWSAAERLIHRILREAAIGGWRANVAVPTLGSIYYVDVGFEAQKVAVEIDGRLHEDDRNLFESDRWRQNALALQGWTVLRFTWLMLTQHPDLVLQTIRSALLFSRQTGVARHP